MSTVLSGMVEGVLAVDSRQRVLLANEASLKLLQLRGPVLQRPLLEICRHVEIEAVVRQALKDDQVCTREVALPGPPRRTLNVLATQLPSESKPGVVVVMQDITALRRLETIRRDFAANVSHELKTPLAAIKAYAETLRMGAIHDRDHNLRFVEGISDEAERLHQLIADLMHLARVEAGDEGFTMTDVDILDVVDRCIARHLPLAAPRQIEMKAKPPSTPVSVWADYDGVFTILTNLLSNAIHYTPGGGQITVRWWCEHEQGVLEVSDTGVGIAPEHHDRVFERFFRVDKARSREFGGTGLGLAIVKHLVQAFNGSITLDSQVGHGSSFRVRLPRSNRGGDVQLPRTPP
jgi:two-component system phosphate regulon sensor histidine kinase PhoR